MSDEVYISIITINFNGVKDTCQMIDSLKQFLSAVSYEIIIVDNASLNNEAAFIEEKYPDVRCFRSNKNLGFAGGNNIGISQAKGKYIFLLNNDTYIQDDSILNLAIFLDSNPSIGAVSPKIKFADSDTIQFAGYTPLSKITLRNKLIGFKEADYGQYNEAHASTFLHGAAMMLRRNIMKDIGPMPEIYFLYYEELDWCEQIKKRGFDMWYVPNAQIYHKESSSVGQGSPLRCYYLTRNRLLFAWRNRYGIVRLLSLSYQLIIANPKNILYYCIKRRFDLVKSTFMGIYDFIKMKNKKI